MNRKVALVVLGALGVAATLAVVGLVVFLATRQTTQPTNDEEKIRQQFPGVMTPVIDNLAANEELSIEEIRIEGRWAIIESTVVDKNTGDYTLGEGTVIIFKKEGSNWEGARPGTATYKKWLDEIPSTLIPEDLKNWLR